MLADVFVARGVHARRHVMMRAASMHGLMTCPLVVGMDVRITRDTVDVRRDAVGRERCQALWRQRRPSSLITSTTLFNHRSTPKLPQLS